MWLPVVDWTGRLHDHESLQSNGTTMSTEEATPVFDVENTRVFNYRQELIVELHGHTPDGEFEAVSYAFGVDPDGEDGLRSPEIDTAHERFIREALAETDYTLS